MEIVLEGNQGTPVKVIKEKTDPECMMVSIGGINKKGYYCVVRGDDMQEIEDMLVEVTEVFKEAHLKLKQDSN